MKIPTAIFIAISINLPALAQVSESEEKRQYIQIRCDELQKANLLIERKGCETFFDSHYNYLKSELIRYLTYHPNELRKFPYDEFKYANIEPFCKDFFGTSPWFGFENDPKDKKSYEACLDFYTKKQPEAWAIE